MKIGDNEAEWSSLVRLARETAESTAEVTATRTVRSELEIALSQLQKTAPQVAESMSVLAFIFHAKDTLNAAVSELEGVEYVWYKPGKVNYDVLAGRNGKKATYQIANDTQKYEIAEPSSLIYSELAEFDVDRLLLIVKGEIPRALRAAAMKDPLVELVSISYGDDDLSRLKQAVASLLEIS